nr:hypothetical protein [Paraburkholderia phytofirmans]
MNPNGNAPCLADGENRIWETDAIICLLARYFPTGKNCSMLYSTTPVHDRFHGAIKEGKEKSEKMAQLMCGVAHA